MMSKSNTALAAAALMLATSVAVAQSRFPNLDVEKNCRSRAKSTEEMMGDKTVTANLFKACVKTENEAKAAIAAAWKDIPPDYKAKCIKPNDYSPSYAEWIACLEMNIDVKHLRKQP